MQKSTFHWQHELQVLLVAEAKENVLNGTAGALVRLEKHDVLLRLVRRTLGALRDVRGVRQIFRGHTWRVRRTSF